MQIAVHTAEPAEASVDMVAIGVFAGQAFAGAAKVIDQALGGVLRAAAKEQDFTGKSKQRITLHTLGKLRCKRVTLLGLGAPDAVDSCALVDLGANVIRAANAVGAKSALWVPPSKLARPETEVTELLARGAVLGAYRYLTYKSDKGRAPTLGKLFLQRDTRQGSSAILAAAKRGTTVADGICLARDLVNESPLQLYPESFAARASSIAREAGLRVKVLTPSQLEKMGMNLLLGVGAGSTRAPRLVHLTYTPVGKRNAKKKPIVLVGKGITFDSGGLSLKPMPGMAEMKVDMHGAATVVGVLSALARLKADVPVHGILALAENMPSGSAIRPGDVITSASGKTVEVNNTDAEGRLVLADALHYAQKLKPARIIDFATLTGACMIALGPSTTGLFSNDDALAGEILASARRAGEDLWRMPLTDSLRAQLKSDVADMKNTGERWGGAIIAALFLSDFAGDGPWAHLDIAGPATSAKEYGALAKGGTGVAIASIVDLITGTAQA